MARVTIYLLLSFSLRLAQVLLLVLVTSSCRSRGTAAAATWTKDKDHYVIGTIGAIVDKTSRLGREEIVAMEIAKEDLHHYCNQTLILHLKHHSPREPLSAAFAAMDLINTQQVQAIVGPQTWEQGSLVADIGTRNQVPIFSLADTTSEWATQSFWPFLVGVSPDRSAQMKAIAAIIQSWNWHRVTVIHEDVGSWTNGVLTHLHVALGEVGAEISQFVALSSFASSDSISIELENLKDQPCRVFVVHLSFQLALRVFKMAEELKMMEKDYVWITTDQITSLVHSIDASIISSMQGIIGVKSYFMEAGQHFQDFNSRFRKMFRRQNPEEDNNEPGIFAVEAYDAIWTIALALNRSSKSNKQLLGAALQTEFDGLSGRVQFRSNKLAPPPVQIFRIINVVGKSYRELGFWSNGSGFSETIGETANYSHSMGDLEQVLWPGGPRYTPKGWTRAKRAKLLKVGVPAESGYAEYVKVEYNQSLNKPYFSGFAIEAFRTVVECLPFSLPYQFIAFNNNSYNDLVEQIPLKRFDAVVGDVAIVASRYEHVEFSHPYSQTGLMLVVPARSSNKAWSFIKPFTKSMWASITALTIYNGFVVWLVERNASPQLRGSVLHQMVIVLWLSFNTLFSLQGGRLHSNLSRMSMVVWLFVALVVIQTYTANLTSMLTVQRLEPTINGVDALLESNSVVGYCTGSYLEKYLVDVLHFPRQNVKNYTTAEAYFQAFNKKEIAAVFIESSLAKIFLAKYCNKFIQAGPTFNVGGFGFAFPRGSPLLASINEALLKISENGTLLQLENKYIGVLKQCPSKEDETPSLSPNGFRALFIITAGTSTISVAVYLFSTAHSFFKHKTIRGFILSLMKDWCLHQRQRFSRRVSHIGSPRNSTSDHAPNQVSQV